MTGTPGLWFLHVAFGKCLYHFLIVIRLGENKLGDCESSICVGRELKLSEIGKKQVVFKTGAL